MPQLNPPTCTASVAIYDRDGSATINGLSPHERIAACYRWASARGYTVIDQVSGYGSRNADPALDSLLESCATHQAGLLVYSRECLTVDAAAAQEVSAHLGGLVLTVTGDGEAPRV